MMTPQSGDLEGQGQTPAGPGDPGAAVVESPQSVGSISIREKVRSLRIDDSAARKRPSNAVLLMASIGWCLAMAATGTAVLLGYKAYRSPGTESGKEAGKAEVAAETKSPAPLTQGKKKLPENANPDSSSVGDQSSAEQVSLESKGYVTPVHLILVTPKVGGMLTKLNIREGDIVDKGSLIAEIEKVDYQSDVARAENLHSAAKFRLQELLVGARPEEIEQSELELREAQRQLKQMELDLARTRRLSDSASLSVRELEQSQYGYEAMQQKVKRLETAYELIRKGPRKERIDAARSEVQQLEAELAKAKWRLDNCTISAPIAGMILSKKAEENNMVNPGAFNGSFSICEMADLRDVEVELDIQERDISKLFLHQECLVLPDAWQSSKKFLAIHPRGYTGYVSRIMPTANRSKGAVPVRVRIVVPNDEQGVFIKPDMGAMVTFFNREIPAQVRNRYSEERAGVKPVKPVETKPPPVAKAGVPGKS